MTPLQRRSIAGGLLGALALGTAPASACGGFFCSSTQPVNQAAERIVFADNGDGTVTAVIQILYQGPSQNFSWVLPISSVPGEDGIGVGSDLAFTRLQALTNPQYSLTTRIEGQCRNTPTPTAVPGNGNFGAAATGGSSSVAPSGTATPPVTVEASGEVGAFEWTVISLDPNLSEPADAAVAWLEENGYDVSPGSPELLGPYLADGMYLLALKLTKGANTGSIRPIRITYEGDKPVIPIKLTAVAANDDMGVLVWLLGEERGVPFNYYSLELNEAYINWFSAGTNYGSVVTQAADEAGGQGFVTEFAGSSDALKDQIWSPAQEQQWTALQNMTFSSFGELYQAVSAYYGGFSGFWDALAPALILPEGVKPEDFKSCPNCYAFELSPSRLFDGLEEHVIEPMRSMQQLLTSRPVMTRLYTTLSAMEMTEDPLFTFNADLPPVSNVHTAERVIECNPSVEQFNAPWRIELPQGGVVRGAGSSQAWPVVPEQPYNRRVLQLGDTGSGMVAEDHTARLAEINAPAAPRPPSTGGGGSGGEAAPAPESQDSGCAVSSPASGRNGALGLLALSLLALPLRRRARQR
ncbi:MAG: DUF2330 domain-containing protein [Myxococcota bacterium]|nr:DUF2330 domain-containing protein [Myxococcota bacterium]